MSERQTDEEITKLVAHVAVEAALSHKWLGSSIEKLCEQLGLCMADRAAQQAEITRLVAPIDSYACERCGRRDGLDAVAADELWSQISEGRNLLCLWCMDAIAHEKGLTGSLTLHFCGKALTGCSQSEADAEHVTRLVARVGELERVARMAVAIGESVVPNKCLVYYDDWADDAFTADEFRAAAAHALANGKQAR